MDHPHLRSLIFEASYLRSYYRHQKLINYKNAVYVFIFILEVDDFLINLHTLEIRQLENQEEASLQKEYCRKVRRPCFSALSHSKKISTRKMKIKAVEFNNLLEFCYRCQIIIQILNNDSFQNGLLDDASIINTTIVGESRVHQHNQGTEGKIHSNLQISKSDITKEWEITQMLDVEWRRSSLYLRNLLALHRNEINNRE